MEPYRLHASLGYKLSIAARLQERRLDEGLKALGLTRTTWCVLLGLGNEGLTQPSDIARFIGIDRTATSRALRQMEAAGLLERQTGDGDRRTTRVTLSPKGADLIKAGTPMAMANNEAMRSRLTETEYKRLVALLEKVITEENPDLSAL